VTKLSAKAALREWRAGWRRFFLAGAAPGGGGGGGVVDRGVVDGGDTGGEVGGREGEGVVRGVRAVTRWSRAASSASF
jgi:hypothetical protein